MLSVIWPVVTHCLFAAFVLGGPDPGKHDYRPVPVQDEGCGSVQAYIHDSSLVIERGQRRVEIPLPEDKGWRRMKYYWGMDYALINKQPTPYPDGANFHLLIIRRRAAMDLGWDTRFNSDRSGTSRAKEILILERDPSTATYLDEFLERRGYHVSLATQERGWDVLQKRRIDGIILSLDDANIPGWEIVRNIRTHYSQVPLILMGSGLTRQTVREAFGVGVKGFISKPLYDNQLKEALFIFEGHFM